MKPTDISRQGQRIRFYTKRAADGLGLRIETKEYQKELQRRTFGKESPNNGNDIKVIDYYNLQPPSDERRGQEWTVKPYNKEEGLSYRIFEKWMNFQRRSKIKRPDSLFISARIQALLFETIKIAQIKANRGRSLREAIQSPSGPDLMTLTGMRLLSMPLMRKGEQFDIRSYFDYSISSGKPEDLDISLVIRREQPGEDSIWRLLKPMAMIHHARRVAGKNGEIYGIATDSKTWTFAHLDKHDRYSYHVYHSWTRDRAIITAHIMRILRYAGDRAATAFRAKSGGRTTSELTGCRVSAQDSVIYSILEEETTDNSE